MHKKLSDEAWEDYIYWQGEDKKTLKKINNLIKSIERDGESEGIGKPEALKGHRSGFYSRHIDEKNRLVYRVIDNVIEIVTCREHYG